MIKEKIALWFLSGAQKDGLRRKILVMVIRRKINQLLEANEMKSWKTTIFGLIGAVGGVVATIKEPSWVGLVGQLMVAIGAGGIGISARDNDKTSEDVNAK